MFLVLIFLLISYFTFSSLILSSTVMISFYILPKIFFLNRERSFEARVASVTNKEYGFAVHFFLKIHEVFKVNI